MRGEQLARPVVVQGEEERVAVAVRRRELGVPGERWRRPRPRGPRGGRWSGGSGSRVVMPIDARDLAGAGSAAEGRVLRPAQGRTGRPASDRSRMCAPARGPTLVVWTSRLALPGFVLRTKQRWVANGLPDYPLWIAALIDSSALVTAGRGRRPAARRRRGPGHRAGRWSRWCRGSPSCGRTPPRGSRSWCSPAAPCCVLMTALPGRLRVGAVPADPGGRSRHGGRRDSGAGSR